jgi:hypothetical protein
MELVARKEASVPSSFPQYYEIFLDFTTAEQCNYDLFRDHFHSSCLLDGWRGRLSIMLAQHCNIHVDLDLASTCTCRDLPAHVHRRCQLGGSGCSGFCCPRKRRADGLSNQLGQQRPTG